MSPHFETPSHDALLAEQSSVQGEKFQGRLLDEYNSYIFPGQQWTRPRGSAVADFLRPITGANGERVGLDTLLNGMSEVKGDQPVNWVDMGGGRGLAMRQLNLVPGFKDKVRTHNVDLFDFGLEGLTIDELAHLERHAPGITDTEAGPILLTDNAESVTLPHKADIITSVEAIQYLNNPVEALANWYNQLVDDGILVITAEHNWAGWIRYGDEQDKTLSRHLLEEFSRAGIRYAVTSEPDWANGTRPNVDPDDIRVLAVQKKTGTSLRVNAPLSKVWTNPYHFKAAYYEVPVEGSIIEVIKARDQTGLGTVAMDSINK